MGTADRIAYVNHDIDDAIRAGILREADLPDTTHRVLGANHSARIETLVTDMVRTSAETGGHRHEPRGVGRHDGAAGVSVRKRVHGAFGHGRGGRRSTCWRICSTTTPRISTRCRDYRAISEGDDLRAVTDCIAGMTDRYATATYQRLFIPTPFRIGGGEYGEGGGPYGGFSWYSS